MKKQMFEIHSLDELKEVIENNKGVLFIDFTSPTCGPCLMLEPIFEELVENNECSIAKVNVIENKELAIKFNVSATPTVAILKDSEIVKTIIGYQPLEIWQEIIEKI